MPSRFFTSGRKFSTTTSAFLTNRLKAASPSGAFRLSVMLRLLRCRFWKSGPSRGPPSGAPVSSWGGYAIPMLAALAIAAGGVQANDEATMKELATTGKLRVGVVAAPSMSAFFVTKDAAGQPRGVTADLGAALAKKLGVPVEFMVAPNS